MAVWLVPVSLIFIDAISFQLTNQATKASLKGLLKQSLIYINISVIYLEFKKTKKITFIKEIIFSLKE